MVTFAKIRFMKRFHIMLVFSLAILLFQNCSINNVEEDKDLQKYFTAHHLKGSFALLDNIHQKFNVYDLSSYRDSSYAPGNSFDILSSLVAIETGRVNDQNSMLKTANDSSASISLIQAFKLDSNEIFTDINHLIGKDTMQFWLDSLHYGKIKLKSQTGKYWQSDSLKITPDEQLGFVEKLYFASLPFQKRTMQIVRTMMIQENNPNYTLAYKKGWTPDASKSSGWIQGWVEENKHVYFFVLHATSTIEPVEQNALVSTLKEILTHYGFFQGKK